MNRSALYFSVFLLLLSSCGRKNNNFFVFTKKEKPQKINRLTLPVVKGLKITHHENHTVTLAWYTVKHENVIGYNLYRFVRTAFIPRKPLNKKPITQETFTETIPKSIRDHKICYVIRAVFLIQNKIIEGPTSKVCPYNP